MICSKCGNNIDNGTKFCSSCGTPIAAAQNTAPANPQPPQAPQAQPVNPNPQQGNTTYQQPINPAPQQQNNTYQQTQNPQPNPTTQGYSNAQQPQQNPQQNYQQNYQQQPNYNNQGFQSQFTQTDDHTHEYQQYDIQQNKVYAILSYIGILFLVPIFAAKNSPFAKFHANQGLALFIAEIAVGILNTIGSWIPYIGWIFSVASGLVSLACVIFCIMGIVYAAQGQAKELPIIGKIKIIK